MPTEQNQKVESARPQAAVAETARQEGAQGRVGKMAGDTVGNGAVDTSDPVMQAKKKL